MSLYNQDDQDYSGRVRYEPPPQSQNSAGSIIITFLVIAVIYLLWDKFTGDRVPPNQLSVPSTNPAVAIVTNAEAAENQSAVADQESDDELSSNHTPAPTNVIPEFDFYINPTERLDFYLTEDVELLAVVEHLSNYRINWIVERCRDSLHLSTLDWVTRSVCVSASGLSAFDSNNAIRVELYDQPGNQLLETRWIDVVVRYPLEIDLPTSAETSILINYPTIITPTVEWEGGTVLSFGSPSPPNEMLFEWRWDNGELTSTDPTFTIPNDYFLSRGLYLTVSYKGFSADDQMRIN